ncbi:MAG: rRNA (cytidine-2'-O-)-methyltransferase, partial [Kangiellaceae bacterium]|nr:rRNA (cytidine-2'-O-)-methyltransferase [Kangiellaceae bacterium]
GENRRVVIAREITKTFETVLNGNLSNLCEILEQDPNQAKGEFVVLVKGADKNVVELSDESRLLALKLIEYLPGKQAAKIVAELHGVKKNMVYQFLLDQNSE